MKLHGTICTGIKFGIGLVAIAVLTLVGCGGGGGGGASNTSGPSSLTPAQVAAISAAEIAAYSGSQVATLGVNIKYLSDAALNALSYMPMNSSGPIQSISAAQIAALSPAQVRMIGAAGPGGTVGTAQLLYLNTGAWAALASDPLQVAAITPAEVATLSGYHIAALGTNINQLSNAALNALLYTPMNSSGPIQSISAAQIAALTPAQVRMIGAAGPGGTVGTAQLLYLNMGAWAALANDPLQVAAITPAEVATLSGYHVTALGKNINQLSNAALNALLYTPMNSSGPIQSISAAQIAALSPAQVRMIGAAGPGGTVGTSQIVFLNSGAWATLASDPLQVAAITPAEVATLVGTQIAALGANIQYLTAPALGALLNTPLNSSGQLQSLSAVQIAALSSAQIGVIAGLYTNTGIAYLNLGAFSTLSASQVAVLTPTQAVGISAAQLASLSTTAIAGFAPATIASFTAAQTASLSAAQHTACGC